jgi:hypothetical protein
MCQTHAMDAVRECTCHVMDDVRERMWQTLVMHHLRASEGSEHKSFRDAITWCMERAGSGRLAGDLLLVMVVGQVVVVLHMVVMVVVVVLLLLLLQILSETAGVVVNEVVVLVHDGSVGLELAS